MFLLHPPSNQQIDNLLLLQAHEPFNYPDVGATRTTPPAGWVVDYNQAKLGSGMAIFERAVAALHRWQPFNIGWMQLCWPTAPPSTGLNLAVVAHLPGLSVFNACRVVYTFDEDDSTNRRVGFAYGTLPAHVARGEERFSIEWRHHDNSVWYTILAFSRPNHPLAYAGYPFTRLMQRRFARASKRAMQQVGDGGR